MAADTSTTTPTARRRLGRGLGSLISSAIKVDLTPPQAARPPVTSIAPPSFTPTAAPASAPSADLSEPRGPGEPGIRMLALDEIQPNPHQPRQHFDEEALQALAKSIQSSGLMQPIVVRPARAGGHASGGGGFQLIAGERRWRAAQIAGLSRIPAIVRSIDDRTAAELSLVENLQREDLNPMERAEAFRRLIDEFGLTHNDVAQRVGLDRTSVTNHLRLNELDEFTKDAVRAARLSLGHAKALLAITNIEARGALAAVAVREEWSVRELERHVKQGRPSSATKASDGAGGGPALTTPHMADLQKRLAAHLGTKVHLRAGRAKGAGTLIIEFYSLDQFEGLMRRMQFETD